MDGDGETAGVVLEAVGVGVLEVAGVEGVEGTGVGVTLGVAGVLGVGVTLGAAGGAGVAGVGIGAVRPGVSGRPHLQGNCAGVEAEATVLVAEHFIDGDVRAAVQGVLVNPDVPGEGVRVVGRLEPNL